MNPATYQWAQRHGVSPQALKELAVIFGTQRWKAKPMSVMLELQQAH